MDQNNNNNSNNNNNNNSNNNPVNVDNSVENNDKITPVTPVAFCCKLCDRILADNTSLIDHYELKDSINGMIKQYLVFSSVPETFELSTNYFDGESGNTDEFSKYQALYCKKCFAIDKFNVSEIGRFYLSVNKVMSLCNSNFCIDSTFIYAYTLGEHELTAATQVVTNISTAFTTLMLRELQLEEMFKAENQQLRNKLQIQEKQIIELQQQINNNFQPQSNSIGNNNNNNNNSTTTTNKNSNTTMPNNITPVRAESATAKRRIQPTLVNETNNPNHNDGNSLNPFNHVSTVNNDNKSRNNANRSRSKRGRT